MTLKKKLWLTAVAVFGLICFAMLTSCATRTPTDTKPEVEVKGESKVLVAYMTWSGHLRTLSEWVADETGGELFRILVQDEYPKEYSDTTERAKEELEKGIRPVLSTHISPDVMKNYDIVYVGFPVWWYDVPMAVWTFAEEYDFSGKTIVPFFSHQGTSDGANSMNTIKKLFPHSTVVEKPLSIRGTSAADSEEEVRAWVKANGHSHHP
ncbi:MAG: flavodoxin [Proteobacteria bacterium]|jgi:flavodoxin|nr:flavodoxin [Pseudomonadota bacterium]